MRRSRYCKSGKLVANSYTRNLLERVWDKLGHFPGHWTCKNANRSIILLSLQQTQALIWYSAAESEVYKSQTMFLHHVEKVWDIGSLRGTFFGTLLHWSAVQQTQTVALKWDVQPMVKVANSWLIHILENFWEGFGTIWAALWAFLDAFWSFFWCSMRNFFQTCVNMGPRWVPRGLWHRFWVDFRRFWKGYGEFV